MTGLLILLIGLVAMLAAGAVGWRVLGRIRSRDAKLADRLATLRPTADGTSTSAALFGPDSGPRFLRVRFARADLQIGARNVYLAVATTLAVGVALVWFNHPVIALVVVATAALGSLLALEFVAARNMATLVRDLPFLLDGVRQHLTVGASLQQALIRAVENSGPHIQRPFLPMARRIQNGATVVEGLSWLAGRIDLPEIDMLLVAVQTNTRFGGGMSPTLIHLSQLLRDSQRVKRELRGATAETRLSGWVLAGLPVLALFAIMFMNPGYAGFLTDTETGHKMLATAVGFQVVGCFFMNRVMRLDF